MHRFVKNWWNRCNRKNIIRIFSCSSPLREGPQWEEFCYAKVLLHVRHRDIQQLTKNSSIAWSFLYEYYIEEINSGPTDLLGLPTDNEENGINEDDGELLEDDEKDEYQLDWMILVEMGPNAVINSGCDLGSRDMDRNHNWINDVRK